MQRGVRGLALGAVCWLGAALAHAQGVLTVQPGRSASTLAGNGIAGYTGDGLAAANATVAQPSAMVYDAAGNLFFADTQNHAVREQVAGTGLVVTVAGTGVAGFSGDGGPATAAQLDTPTGLAFDAVGALYIADSHNHRVRRVMAGVISSVVGTGAPGFSGDGGPASAAQLALPSALAFDSNGRLLIADTNNHRIRAVLNGNVATVAGNGDELFAGDGGVATAASLDQPTGVAADAAGNFYIADKRNGRVREVSAAGIITTVAGSGTPSFAGSFAGDGGAATAASLARPVGVSVDSAGTLYIADTNNQRIRQVTGGTIGTVAGSGDQGFAGDGATLTGAMLNAPKIALADATGNLLVADTANQRLRQGLVPTLHFASQAVGVASASQTVALSNIGTAALTVSTFNVTGAFTATSGGTCGTLPLTLQPGTGCTAAVSYLPVASGIASGTLSIGGSGLLPQTVLLAGTSGQGTTTTSLIADISSALAGQPVTFTATVQPVGAGTPDGSVQFYDGSSPLGSSQKLVGKTASVSIDLSTGAHSITAMYSGSANFLASTSPAVAEAVADFNFVLVPASGTSAGVSGSTSQTVMPGQSASYAFSVQPLGGSFNVPVTLSATGLPPGATVSFSPQTVTVGAASAPFTVTVQTSAVTADFRPAGSSKYAVLVCSLFLPMLALARRKVALQSLRLCLGIFVAVLAATALSGCGVGNGYLGQAQKTYTLQIVGTATGLSGATLQHVATVQLTLQ